jgi:cytochrome b
MADTADIAHNRGWFCRMRYPSQQLFTQATMTPTSTAQATRATRVWDLPTRIFHWSLLACIAGLFITVNIGGNWMQWHFRFGYAVLTLLLFRIVWGLVGGRWSRFATFIYAPSTILAYFKGQGKPEHSVGHNPMGAASVFGMLGFLILQVGSGLFSDDDIAFQGPLAKFVSSARVSTATWYHKEVGSKVLVALIVLHVAAIVFYLYKKKENLIRPMLDGDKHLAVPVTPSRDDAASRAAACAVLAACAAAVWWVVKLGG